MNVVTVYANVANSRNLKQVSTKILSKFESFMKIWFRNKSCRLDTKVKTLINLVELQTSNAIFEKSNYRLVSSKAQPYNLIA